MNITLPDGNTKSLVLIKDLSYIPLCEVVMVLSLLIIVVISLTVCLNRAYGVRNIMTLMSMLLMANVICAILGGLVAEAIILQDIFVKRRKKCKQLYFRSVF